MTRLANSYFDTNQLVADFEANLSWDKLIPEKSFSFFHPIDDKNFEQTDLLFLCSAVLFDTDSLIANVIQASRKLCFDAFAQGAEPLAFVLDVAASWPEMAPSNFPWRELMPRLSEGFAQMGLPVTIGNVRALSRADAAFQYDSFSILLVAKHKVEYQENVTVQWPVYSVLPKDEVYHSNEQLIEKGLFALLRELSYKHALRFSALMNSPVDVLPQAAIVSKRALKIDVDNLIKDALFVIPEEAQNETVEAVSAKWGFELIKSGRVELGDMLALVQNEKELFTSLKTKALKTDISVDVPLDSCSCRFSAWLPDQEEDDAEAFREMALSVFLHPMHLGRRGLALVFDSTSNQIIPSINYLQDAVILRYRSLSDILGLNFHWIPTRVGLDSCHLQEYLANAVRELVCSGISPRAVVASFVESIDNHRQACIKKFCADFGINYQAQIYPSVQHSDCQFGMGLIVLGSPINSELPKKQAFKQKGDLIFIIGKSISNLSGSVFQLLSQTNEVGSTPPVNLTMEKRIVDLIKLLWQNGLIEMASNIGCGGLFTALTNSALAGNLGFDVTTDAELRSDSFLFSEAPGRVIVSVKNENEAAFIDQLIESDISFSILGHVTKDELRIDDLSYGFVADFKQMMLEGWNAVVRR